MAVDLVVGVIGVVMALKTPVTGPEDVDQPAGAGSRASEIFKRFLTFLRSIFSRIDELYNHAIEETVPHKKVEK